MLQTASLFMKMKTRTSDIYCLHGDVMNVQASKRSLHIYARRCKSNGSHVTFSSAHVHFSCHHPVQGYNISSGSSDHVSWTDEEIVTGDLIDIQELDSSKPARSDVL